MKNKGVLAVLTLILTGLPVVFLRAQPAAVQQMQNTQQAQQQSSLPSLVPGTNAPELYPGENSDVGPQRILRVAPRPTPWELYLDSQFFYTNNATFSSNPKTGSGVFVNTAQISYSPGPYALGPGSFAPSAGLASQWYNYGRKSLAPFSFNAQTGFLTGKYNLGTDWQVFGGASYTRLLKPNYEESYREYLPNLGVQRLFTIRDNLIVILADQVAYHFTHVPPVPFFASSTTINDRFDDTVNLAVAWQLSSHLIAQPYYRFQYTYYRKDTLQTSSRSDYLQTGGLTLAYYFNKTASVRTFFNYNAKKSSDRLTPDYQEYDGGLGVSADIKF
jgi:hypothetical protein